MGTHIDELPAAERVNMLRTFHQNIADLYGTPVDSNYPTISRIHFVGKEESKLTQMFYTNKYDELADIIYEEACRMEIPKSKQLLYCIFTIRLVIVSTIFAIFFSINRNII